MAEILLENHREDRHSKREKLEQALNLREQMAEQYKYMEELGIVETLTNGEKGIRSIKMNREVLEYPLPEYEEIIEQLLNLDHQYGEGFLDIKIEQGFTKVLCVPFAKPLQALLEAYGKAIIDCSQNRPLSFAGTGQPAELNLLHVWRGYQDADINCSLVYDVRELTPFHKGKTKAQILQQRKLSSPSTDGSGWDILLLEKEINIPREGRSQEFGPEDKRRKQIEAGKSPEEYIDFFLSNKNNANSPYHGEDPLRIEDWLMLAIYHLKKDNQIIDDLRGSHRSLSSGSYNLGSYLYYNKMVPCTYFFRDLKYMSIDKHCVDLRQREIGVRSCVKASKI